MSPQARRGRGPSGCHSSPTASNGRASSLDAPAALARVGAVRRGRRSPAGAAKDPLLFAPRRRVPGARTLEWPARCRPGTSARAHREGNRGPRLRPTCRRSQTRDRPRPRISRRVGSHLAPKAFRCRGKGPSDGRLSCGRSRMRNETSSGSGFPMAFWWGPADGRRFARAGLLCRRHSWAPSSSRSSDRPPPKMIAQCKMNRQTSWLSVSNSAPGQATTPPGVATIRMTGDQRCPGGRTVWPGRGCGMQTRPRLRGGS